MVLIQQEPKKIYIWDYKVFDDYSAMRWPCPEWFHVPTTAEWNAVFNAWKALWAWSANPWTNLIKRLRTPKAWRIVGNYWTIDYQWSYGTYRCSDAYNNGYWYYFDPAATNPTTYAGAANWFNIRAFKDTPVVPDSTWTVYYQGTWSAGIFRSSALWLISISSDWTTRYTIQDKNLWATQLYNHWDTLSEANCWYYYQRWNNYWFPFTWPATTSSTQIDASSYWPWNYYSSSTFIKSSSWWQASNNLNLWGGTTWVQPWQTWQEIKKVYLGSTQVRPALPTYKTYTIVWNETPQPSQFFVRYEDDAAWLTQGSSDFDDFFWYYPCRLSSAWVETVKGTQSWWVINMSSLWTLTSWDNVMIAFPRLWIKMSKSWTQVTLSITNDPNAEWFQYYAHTKWTDAKDVLYLWAYKMSSWYKSLSWKAPLVSQTRATFRSWVKSAYDSSAWTNRYSQITWYPRNFINALYMMKYWNPDSQSVVGQWYTWWSAKVNTWWTNSQTNATYWTTSNTTQARLFWLEDWWGNAYEWMDGCYFNSSTELTVDKTNNVFQDSDYTTNLWATPYWYMSAIAWTNDGMFENKSVSGWSSSTYYTDYCYASASCVLLAGGRNNDGGQAGVFRIYGNSTSYSWNTTGSRLMFL